MERWVLWASVGTLATVASFAQAQTGDGLTISGNLDVGLRVDSGSGTMRSVQSNSLLPSRVTFGSLEELGGGYRAQMVLETGLTVNNGAGAANPPGVPAGGLTFGRFAAVALGSERTGYISAGRQYTPLFVMAASGVADVYGGAALGGSVLVSSLTVRTSNSIAYTYGYGPRTLLRGSPASGLGIAVMVAPGESSTVGGAGNQAGFNVTYGNGTWWAGYGYHQVHGNSAAINPAAPDSSSPLLRQQTVAAAYSIGAWKFNTGFNQGRNGIATNSGINRTGWYVGTSYQFAENQEIKAFYGRVNDKRPINADFSTWQVGYLYSLSKLTQLYALAGVVDNSATGTTVLSNPTPPTITAGTTARSVAVGILKRF